MRVVLTGGGSGGHVYPALSVAQALGALEKGVEVSYVGGASGIEAEIVKAAGLPFTGVTTKKLRKLVSFSTIGVLLALLKGYREASTYLRGWKPDVVISTGGYVAAATVIAAARQGVKTVILAPDAVPGRTNLWLSRWANHICVMFEESVSFYPTGKTVVTGLPIRADIVSDLPPSAARAEFGLQPDLFTLLVTGGSQGAQRLNEIVQETVRAFGGPIQVLHQVGAKNWKDGTTGPTSHGEAPIRYEPRPYFDALQMPLAYRSADIVLCRSGVGSLAEGTANGLPLLMVPLPTAYADHQTANARAIERGGGGILLKQADLTPPVLIETVEGLRRDTARRQSIASASRALGRPDAARAVAEIALKSLEDNHPLRLRHRGTEK
jgi:UDP-N-acetylglucosamine--N-acetylmuramyl-(pentapeptide) pyrophosphoryl-undecaprenol N-acetylglucosamine transferase